MRFRTDSSKTAAGGRPAPPLPRTGRPEDGANAAHAVPINTFHFASDPGASGVQPENNRRGKYCLRRTSRSRRSFVETKTRTSQSAECLPCWLDQCMTSRAERECEVDGNAVHGHAQSNTPGLHRPATMNQAVSTQL